jgi:predicted nucleic acid-binding protein
MSWKNASTKSNKSGVGAWSDVLGIFLDSNIVIYLIEQTAIWGPKASSRIAASLANSDQFMTSDLTRLECHVGPQKSADFATYDTFFTLSDVLMFPLSAAVCDRAAEIRARYRFKLADSLHLTAAIESGSSVFLTNDARLSAFSGLTVEILS